MAQLVIMTNLSVQMIVHVGVLMGSLLAFGFMDMVCSPHSPYVYVGLLLQYGMKGVCALAVWHATQGVLHALCFLG